MAIRSVWGVVVGVNIAVPAEVAQSLISDDLAVRPLKNRAEPALVAATIEVVGAVANLVTIAVALPQVREGLRRCIRWARRKAPTATQSGNDHALAITIRLPSGATQTLRLGATDAEVDVVVKEITESAGMRSAGS